MAKITFTKLNLKKNDSIKMIDINGNQIEVKQYLPVEDKLKIVSETAQTAADGNEFMNLFKTEICLNVLVIFSYTNISFTEKQKEDIFKLYDLLKGNGIIDKVIDAIPDEEYSELYNAAIDFCDCFYNQRNSAKGILTSVIEDYNNADLNANEIINKLRDPESLKLVKDVLTKLG